MTRIEIESLQPGIEINILLGREVENGHYGNLPDYSQDMNAALTLMADSRNFGLGLFITPLNSGKWACGRASHIYDIKISDDHYRDKELVIADTAPEAICKMRLILALCPKEAVNHAS